MISLRCLCDWQYIRLPTERKIQIPDPMRECHHVISCHSLFHDALVASTPVTCHICYCLCSMYVPPVPILSQIDPIPTIPSYHSKIHFNIVHPSTSWSSQWSLSFWESQKERDHVQVFVILLEDAFIPLKKIRARNSSVPCYVFCLYFNSESVYTHRLRCWDLRRRNRVTHYISYL
jgi:hypothetical protein